MHDDVFFFFGSNPSVMPPSIHLAVCFMEVKTCIAVCVARYSPPSPPPPIDFSPPISPLSLPLLRRKLKLDIASTYPVLTTEQVDELIPDNVPMFVVKVVTYGGVGVTTYHVKMQPLFFEHRKKLVPSGRQAYSTSRLLTSWINDLIFFLSPNLPMFNWNALLCISRRCGC